MSNLSYSFLQDNTTEISIGGSRVGEHDGLGMNWSRFTDSCCHSLENWCSYLCSPCVRRKRQLGLIPPLLVTGLIFWLYVSWIEAIGYPLFLAPDHSLFTALAIFVTLSINFIFLVTSFYLTYKTIPPSPGTNSVVARLLEEGFIKACRKCGEPKPPRTHHCSTCDRCIPRMDHHCIWVGNCVGQHNHKFFVLFLFYVVMTCGEAALSWIYTTTDFNPKAFLVGIFCLILTVSLGLFGIFHVLMVCWNKTSLECLDGCCSTQPSDYDKGFKANWCEIMGDEPFYWFLPFGNHPKVLVYKQAADV